MSSADWIAVDWGTSQLRAWAMDAAGAVLAARDAPTGMGTLGRDDFEPALRALIGDWLPAQGKIVVMCCGMVGARQGWVEAGYRSVPCAAQDHTELTHVPTRLAQLDVRIVPGLQQTTPPDVMRGEETQLAGLLAQNPGFDGVVCLPGTHTKWVQVSAGEVVSFCTVMTGELFALLSAQSVLRHSVTTDDWDQAAFDAAVTESLIRPEALTRRLFALRAESLIADLSAGAARARLSGLLIGAELAAARGYWLGQNVAIVGAARLADLYDGALQSVGVNAQRLDVAGLTLAGLTAAYKQLNQN